MIQGFKHKGLKKLFFDGNRSGIEQDLIERIELILSRLEVAEDIQALNIPGYRLHSLKGNLKGFWSITVSGNWRIIFRLKDGDVFDVNLVDYH